MSRELDKFGNMRERHTERERERENHKRKSKMQGVQSTNQFYIEKFPIS
jgi:hypothetical protein